MGLELGSGSVVGVRIRVRVRATHLLSVAAVLPKGVGLVHGLRG